MYYRLQIKIALLFFFMMLAGCSEKTNDAEIPEFEKAQYDVNQKDCVDNNLNGFCDDGEISQTIQESEILIKHYNPILAKYDDFILTAVGNSKLISPFTTLINNEVLYNPLVEGSVDKAKHYLTDKLGFDFTMLDIRDGSPEVANEIIRTLVFANKLKSDNPYLNIAAAVDLMIYSNSFAVEVTQAHLDNLINEHLLISDFYPLDTNGTTSVSKFYFIP